MWHDNETDVDLLGFKVHADLIKEIILDPAMLPTSIGVFGDWGSGKSSIVKMLQKDLKALKDQKIVSIYFNGWVFEGYDDAKLALIETMLKELSKRESLPQKAKGLFKSLKEQLDLLRLAKFAGKNLLLPAAKAFATNGFSLIPDAISAIGDIIENPDEFELPEEYKGEEGKKKLKELEAVIKKKKSKKTSIPDVVRKFRSNFEKAIEQSEIDCLVVFIDDLDRCSPERIIDNLEAIKLFLNVKKTAFVIGADQRIVRNAIQLRYKAKDLRDSEIPDYEQLITDYLEKLIQIPYHLPKLSDTEVETYMTLLLAQKELPQEYFEKVVDNFAEFRSKDKYSLYGLADIQTFLKGETDLAEKIEKLILAHQLAPMLAEGLKGNPRQIKRFFNALMLRSKLAKVANFDKLEQAVLAKLMILEYQQGSKRFDELYKWQKEDKGFPKIIKEIEAERDKFDEITEARYKEWKSPTMKKWFELMPQLSDFNLSDYFWLSRDKLGTGMSSTGLIPPIVRSEFKTIVESTTDNQIENRIEKLEEKLTDESLIRSFIDFSCEFLQKEPMNKNAHTILFSLAVYGKTTIETYENMLEKFSETTIKEIPASVGLKLLALEEKKVNVSKIRELVEKRAPKSKFGKAFLRKKEK